MFLKELLTTEPAFCKKLQILTSYQSICLGSQNARFAFSHVNTRVAAKLKIQSFSFSFCTQRLFITLPLKSHLFHCFSAQDAR